MWLTSWLRNVLVWAALLPTISLTVESGFSTPGVEWRLRAVWDLTRAVGWSF